MPQYDNEFNYKFINDNLYGGISLSREEIEIINTKTFQRLRMIKQQGLTSYTFPCADHTRFCHSLGVLHIMGKMASQVVDVKSPEYKILRLSALLHDIGHYPLSHLTEDVYKLRNKAIIENPPDINYPLTRFSEKVKDRYAHHEALGVEVIKHRKDINSILNRMHIDPDELGEIITGSTTNHIHQQLMHSSLDADRLDYLIRDSSSAGVRYGYVDVDYLTRLLVKGKDTKNFSGQEEKTDCIGITIKGIHALEHYLMARYFSYSNVTMHRTTSVFESLAKSIIWYLADNNYIYSNYDNILKILPTSEFLNFNDNFIWTAIKKRGNLTKDPYKLFRETLLYRKRVKIPLEIKHIQSKGEIPDYSKDYYNKMDYIKKHLSDIAGSINLKPNQFGYVEQVLDIESANRDLRDPTNYYEAPRVVDNHKCILLVQSDSSLIKEIFDKELRIFRLFYVDPYPKDKNRSDKLAKNVKNYRIENSA
jgi:HD superfamily phosphohydrolase